MSRVPFRHAPVQKPIPTALLIVTALSLVAAQPEVHVWEKVEITLQSSESYENPYADVEVWADLERPGFKKRCYGNCVTGLRADKSKACNI